jgi:DNA (cytosine-5)-methyltransferase 1
MAPEGSPFSDYDSDAETIAGSDSDLELLDYGKSRLDAADWHSLIASTPDIISPTPEIITIDDDDDAGPQPSPRTRRTQERPRIELPNAEIPSWTLPNGVKVKRGFTVELKDRSGNANGLHSGDFLRILHIIQNQETDEVRLRGHRLRRTKYLGPIWDCESPREGCKCGLLIVQGN